MRTLLGKNDNLVLKEATTARERDTGEYELVEIKRASQKCTR